MNKGRPFFFICGIIQGSHSRKKIYRQDYRQSIKQILTSQYPGIPAYDPFALHPQSLEYSEKQARKVFFQEMRTAAKKRCILIVYLPRASLGTAIEIWEAYKAGNPVFIITPLAINWAVQFLATRIFKNITEFKTYIMGRKLDPYIKKAMQ